MSSEDPAADEAPEAGEGSANVEMALQDAAGYGRTRLLGHSASRSLLIGLPHLIYYWKKCSTLSNNETLLFVCQRLICLA